MALDDPRTVPVAYHPVELRGVRVVVLSGPSAGAECRASARTLRVGTSASNDLVLVDPAVSREHLELRMRRDEIRLLDLGSTNGTRIDDVQVVEAIVRMGQRIAIGSSVLRIDADGSAIRLPMSESTQFGRLVGASSAMREVYALLERVSPTDVSLLVEGESGTGKELAAEAVHGASKRRAGPLVIVDCSAIPPNLFESELFGHVKGAFTGATDDRRGLLEEADGGTIFLDEIGEMPLEQQAKLLRVLERREVRRVGSNRPRPIDVRVVAATNRNLSAEVNRGTFREDLYYRVAGARVTLPPLRARGDDLGLLVRHFVERFDPASVERAGDITASLRARHFPGNVRELRNAVQLALALPTPEEPALGGASAATSEAFAPFLDLPYGAATDALIGEFQRSYVRHALAKEGGNVSAAARRTAMSRRYLQRILSQMGVRAGDRAPEGPDDADP